MRASFFYAGQMHIYSYTGEKDLKHLKETTRILIEDHGYRPTEVLETGIHLVSSDNIKGMRVKYNAAKKKAKSLCSSMVEQPADNRQT